MTQLCTRWQRHNWTKQKHIHTNRAIWMEQIVRRAGAQLVKIPNNRLWSVFVCISFFWVWCDARQCAIFCNIKDSQIHNNPQATLLSTNIDVQTPSVLSSFNSLVANRTTKDNNSRKHGRTHSCHCFVLLWTTLFRQWRVVRASLAFTACPNIHYTHILRKVSVFFQKYVNKIIILSHVKLYPLSCTASIVAFYGKIWWFYMDYSAVVSWSVLI